MLDSRFQATSLRELQAMNIPAFSASLVSKAQEMQPARQQAPVRRLFAARAAKIAVAAALILAIGGTYLYLSKKDQQQASVTKAMAATPGASNKATLTLSNGQVVELSTGHDSLLAQEGGAAVRQSKDALVYTDTGSSIVTNTLTTPRGGKFSVVLPDGSKVWMNSASSLQYPTGFKSGNDRVVNLTGEAYFEVAKNDRMPFIVHVNDLDVRVTGTHFNINAYPDEANIFTTLLEGGVYVSRKNQVAHLTPGLQAVANRIDNTLLTAQVNVKQVMAWKDGLFIFDGKQRNEILRELSRWYDIDVIDRSAASTKTYSGVINRNLNLEELLDLLRESNVLNGKIEQHKLVILP